MLKQKISLPGLLGGNRISVKTLDLNTEFSNITKQLNAIMEDMLLS